MENKKIEVPFVPMIRVTSPVFNSSNDFCGAVVINFKAKQLLDSIRNLASTINGDTFIINYKGHYALHRNKDYEWGHMLPTRAKYNFGKIFPQAWKKIQQKDEGYFISQKGVFIFKDIALCPDYATKHLRPTLLVYIPWKKLIAPIVYIYFELWLLILVLLIIFSGIWTLYRSKKLYYEAELKKFATTDPLTGAANRKHFIDQTKTIIYNAQRYNAIFSLIMIDIDDFKQINDNYGHLVGDEALKNLTNIIMSTLRQTDILCRFGGEEFLVLLQNSDIKATVKIAERIRQKIAALSTKTPTAQFKFTISAGVTAWRTDDSKIDTLIKRADEAMYEAKHQGKNRVIKID